MPSSTLPSHTSMLSGEPPEQHHVTWNNVVTAEKDVVDFSTVFSVARAHGYRTAAFFSKAKFSPLQRPGLARLFAGARRLVGQVGQYPHRR